MSRMAVLTIGAIVAIIYGLGLVFVPATILSMHGMAAADGINFIARSFGSALLGLGYMSFVARNAPSSAGLAALMQGTSVTAVIGFIVSLYAVLNGVMNGMGWVPVIVDLLIAVGYGYFGFMKKA